MSLTEEQELNPEHFYNSIYNLKKAGVKVELTQEQVMELAKCEEDIEYFISNYVKITSLDAGTVLFKPHAYQTRAIKKAVANRFSIWKWPRQQGKTTTVAAILLWYAIFNEKFDIAIVAQQKGQAVEILDRIREMYENLPWWMQPGVFSWNKGSIRLGNKTKVFTAATGGSGVRGKSINILYCAAGDTKVTYIDDDGGIYHTTMEKAFIRHPCKFVNMNNEFARVD